MKPMRIAPAMTFAVVAAGLLLGGCGPTCQTTCHKLYSPDECGIATPGVEWTDMDDQCSDECEVALTFTGELGDYDPDQRPTGGETVELENERQAAAWMQCVEQTSCERLNEGYCPPS